MDDGVTGEGVRGRVERRVAPGALPAGVAVDRRRPGRPAEVSPHLLPLLRGAATAPVRGHHLVVEAEDLPEPPLVGIVSAVVLSSALWCLAGAAGWMFLR